MIVAARVAPPPKVKKFQGPSGVFALQFESLGPYDCLTASALNFGVNRWVLINFLLCSKHKLEMPTVPGQSTVSTGEPTHHIE